jgi:hypothetical protein
MSVKVFNAAIFQAQTEVYWLLHYFGVFPYASSSIHNSKQEFHPPLYLRLVDNNFYKNLHK